MLKKHGLFYPPNYMIRYYVTIRAYSLLLQWKFRSRRVNVKLRTVPRKDLFVSVKVIIDVIPWMDREHTVNVQWMDLNMKISQDSSRYAHAHFLAKTAHSRVNVKKYGTVRFFHVHGITSMITFTRKIFCTRIRLWHEKLNS